MGRQLKQALIHTIIYESFKMQMKSEVMSIHISENKKSYLRKIPWKAICVINLCYGTKQTTEINNQDFYDTKLRYLPI